MQWTQILLTEGLFRVPRAEYSAQIIDDNIYLFGVQNWYEIDREFGLNLFFKCKGSNETQLLLNEDDKSFEKVHSLFNYEKDLFIIQESRLYYLRDSMNWVLSLINLLLVSEERKSNV